MNKSDAQEQRLEALLQAHKEQHRAPERLRRRVLQYAARAERKGKANAFPGRWLLGIAACAALLCLFTLNLMLNQQQNLVPDVEGISVQLHGFGLPVDEVSLSDSLVLAKAQHFEDYQRRQLTIDIHHNKRARLVAMDNGLSLMTCDDELVRISGQLLSDFQQHRRIESRLQLGQWLDIGYDSRGYIQRIDAGRRPLLC